MKQTAILFDLDGTLIDSTKAIVDAFCYAFTQNNYKSPSELEIKNLVGRPLLQMFADLGVKTQDLELVRSTYKTKYHELSPMHTKLLPRAKEAVVLAHSFAKLAVVTTKTSQYSVEILQDLGILEFFEIVIGFEDVQKPKPDKEPILKALQKIKDYKQAWMIGDTQMDILAAQNAQINSFGVLGEYESKESLERFTKNIAKDAFEAVEKIKNSTSF